MGVSLENEATMRSHARADRFANEQATAAGQKARDAVMEAYVGQQYGPDYWAAQDRSAVAYDRAFDQTHTKAWTEEFNRAQPEEWRAVMAEYKASGAYDDDVVR
jgi:hypothetical protein